MLPNLDIDFAGDPDGDFTGAFAPTSATRGWRTSRRSSPTATPTATACAQEVPYQPLLPDAVKIRGQVATGQPMAELQPVRLRDNDGDGILDDSSATTVSYFFEVPDGVDPAEIVVTARLRFRHLPPYFVRDLEDRQDELGDASPRAPRIDADALLEHMVVSRHRLGHQRGRRPAARVRGPAERAS